MTSCCKPKFLIGHASCVLNACNEIQMIQNVINHVQIAKRICKYLVLRIKSCSNLVMSELSSLLITGREEEIFELSNSDVQRMRNVHDYDESVMAKNRSYPLGHP